MAETLSQLEFRESDNVAVPSVILSVLATLPNRTAQVRQTPVTLSPPSDHTQSVAK